MIIPSIDLLGGQAVQLIGGRETAIEAGDPLPIAERFAIAGDLAVIDLDAALGRGSNRGLVEQLVRRHPCRVGGGIRDARTALAWLDAGARQIILGTAAEPEVLSQLPRQRVIAALDGRDGEVVVDGWRASTGARVLDRIAELRHLVGGFLVTSVEREGRLGGIDHEAVRAVTEAAGDTRVTIAGGVTTPEEVGAVDRLGGDSQVGMALYTGLLDLGDAISACLHSDRPDGLWPTVVCDAHGAALGLTYSDRESLRQALTQRRGIYRSRSRGLWVKGESSGSTQELLRVDADCDRDALRFTVRQHDAGFCHTGSWSCWGGDRGLPALERRLQQRLANPDDVSYTVKVTREPGLLAAKLVEEAGELAAARTRDEVVWEAADMIYFTAVAAARGGVALAEILAELDRRGLAVRRRDGSMSVSDATGGVGGRS